MLSEETEVYLSASDDFPPEDIILHGSNNNTADTIEIYEDSILEVEDSVFEVSAIDDETKVIISVDAEIDSDGKEDVTDRDGKMVNEVKVVVGNDIGNDIVISDEDKVD